MSIIDINSSLNLLNNNNNNSISILSYNILLPNSIGGWWVYKMYSHRHSIKYEETTWEYRSLLIKNDILKCNCDIICLQEVYPDSFINDFNFMKDLGYDQYEIYRKGEFRPVIFWKSTKLILDSSPIHRDRCLIIPFRLINNGNNGNNSDNNNQFTSPIYVCNCHLQAGIECNERRFRQIHDSLDTIRKHVTKLITTYIEQLRKESKKKKNETKVVINSDEIFNTLIKTIPIILCGDMNCDPNDLCGAHSLLIYGEATVEGKVDQNNLIKKENGKELSIKKHPFSNFIDTYDMVYRNLHENSLPPPTMIVEELYEVLTTSDINLAPSIILNNLSYNSTLKQYNLYLTSLALDRLTSMFDKYAQTFFPTENNPKSMVMSSEDIKRWLVDINKEWTRGSEYHASKERIKLFPNTNSDNLDNNIDNNNNNNVIVEVIEVVKNEQIESKHDNETEEQDEIKKQDEKPRSFPDNCYLTYLDFCSIYEQMITEGKVWAVSHDMAICGYPLPITSNVYTARYDRIYISGSLQSNLQLVRDIPCGNINEGCPGIGGCLPNSIYPSDHFPVAIALTYPN